MEEITYFVLLSCGGLLFFAALLISIFLQVAKKYVFNPTLAKYDYRVYIVFNFLGIVVALWLMWELLKGGLR